MQDEFQKRALLLKEQCVSILLLTIGHFTFGKVIGSAILITEFIFLDFKGIVLQWFIRLNSHWLFYNVLLHTKDTFHFKSLHLATKQHIKFTDIKTNRQSGLLQGWQDVVLHKLQ
jgi:hypothetical protein